MTNLWLKLAKNNNLCNAYNTQRKVIKPFAKQTAGSVVQKEANSSIFFKLFSTRKREGEGVRYHRNLQTATFKGKIKNHLWENDSNSE